MNTQKVRAIIQCYKELFIEINKEEFYKWEAVECFQKNWDIDAPDFYEMLKRSLCLTDNLLASQNYYPRELILKHAKVNPEFVRQLFKDLYDDEIQYEVRIQNFQADIKLKHKELLFENSTDQDLIAIVVYLCLMFPDNFYLYKYSMFKEFAKMVDYPDMPVGGSVNDVRFYYSLCDFIKVEISKDPELLELHHNRTKGTFFDKSYSILTQDVIYAAVRHFPKFRQDWEQESALNRMVKVVKSVAVKAEKVDILLRATKKDYEKSNRQNKLIGNLGELLVMQYEQERLKDKKNKNPDHKSVKDGDGLGYDILSYDDSGNEIFIEVKTTTGNYNSTFYITQNELECSNRYPDKYCLYRLYDFDDDTNTAKFFTINGDLTHYCITPISYRVAIEELFEEEKTN